ncbi:MAG: hypothetical protein M3Q79_01205, partial [bacterium]|nr:hypothetical protein [bacterium]
MSERIRPIYETSPEQQLIDGEVVLARELVNRESIELHAELLISNRNQYEWEHLPGEDRNNAVTSLFEELTAAGDLSEIDFDGNQAEVHAATIARLLNGYRSNAPAWELKRRFAEISEELTVFEVFCKIANGELPEDTVVVTDSDFPSDSGASLKEIHDQGYRAGNRKGMLREYSFFKDEDGQWVRHLEQISQSNAITEHRTRSWFNQNAAVVPLHATGALNEQVVTSRKRLPDGVVSLMKELDETSEYALRYGEPIAEAAENGRPAYENIRQKSKLARLKEKHFISELENCEAMLTEQLHDGSITYQQKLKIFHQKQEEIIERILMHKPQYAEDARGKAAAVHYRLACQAIYAGDRYQAGMHIDFALKSRDPLAGGSCGGSGSKNSVLGDNPLDFSKSLTENILDNFESDLETRSEEDEFGSLKFDCPKCQKENKRDKH